MDVLPTYLCQDWSQAIDLITPDTIVYVIDGYQGDISQCHVTSHPSPLTPVPELDIVKMAAMLAGLPLDDNTNSQSSNPEYEVGYHSDYNTWSVDNFEEKPSTPMYDDIGSRGTKRKLCDTTESDLTEEDYFRVIEADIYSPVSEPDDREEIPLVKLPPIKRTRRIARPMRDMLLKRRTIRRALKKTKTCCDWNCCDDWRWIRAKEVVADYI